WANNRLRINGALFQEDWDDFQYSFLGQNGLTEIRNAGQARIKGFETDVVWAPVDGLTLSLAASWLDAKTTADYCGVTFTADDIGADDPRVGQPVKDCDDPDAPANTIVQAPKGQELPVQPRFKGNVVARYEFPMGSMRAHIQGAMVTQTSAWSDLRTAERELLGKQPGYTIGDFAFGLSNDTWGLELWIKNASDQRALI